MNAELLKDDEWVRSELDKAWKLCGTKSFWKDEKSVYGIGCALMYMGGHYEGKYKLYLEATMENFMRRNLLVAIYPMPGA